MNVYSFNFGIVTFFLNPGTSELFKKISSTNLFFIGLRTLKPTRTRTLNINPIWHGLMDDNRPSAAGLFISHKKNLTITNVLRYAVQMQDMIYI